MNNYKSSRYNRKKGFGMYINGKIVLVTFFIIFVCVFIWFPIVKQIGLSVGCNSYLKAAADAPTVELAMNELNTAITYLESKHLTNGFSNLIIQDRQSDIGYWYNRLKIAKLDLEMISEDASSLEKSNVLMKLRETLLDANGEITVPRHLAFYPNQWAWMIAIFVWFIVLIAGIPLLLMLIVES